MSPQASRSVPHSQSNLKASAPPSQSMASLLTPLNSHSHPQIQTNVALPGLGLSSAPQMTNGAPQVSSPPVRRGPGRPKGSTNKNKPPVLGPDGQPIPKRPVGRPRKELDPNAPVKPKNPVGRPRKHPLSGSSVSSMTVRPADHASQPSTSVLPTAATTPTLNRASIATNADASNLNGGSTNGLLPAFKQQLPPTSSNPRLAPSPTVAPSTPVRSHSWSSNVETSMMSFNGPHTNGNSQGPHTAQSSTSLLTSTPSNPSATYQFRVFDNSTDPYVPSAVHSPIVEQRHLTSSRHPSSPSAPPSHLQHPSQRPSGPQHPSPQPTVTTIGHRNNSLTGSTTSVSGPPTSRPSSSLNREALEAAIWKEIQTLNLVNPRVTIGSPQTRKSEYNTLKKSVPPHVLEAYNAFLLELRRDTPAGCPDVYTVLNNFWLPTTSTYFKLINSRASFSSSLGAHRFFYWDPMYLLISGIQCPACSSRLQRDGFHGPCPVLNIGEPYYLIGQVYTCPTCTKRPEGALGLYLSWDENVLRMLPEMLSKEFPAHIKPWGAFSDSFVDFVRASAKAGTDAKQVLEIIRTICKMDTLRADSYPLTQQQLPPSPVPTPASPELPERQRSYYRSWHRNTLLPESLAPPGESPPSTNRSRDASTLGEDPLHTFEESNVDSQPPRPGTQNSAATHRSKGSDGTRVTSKQPEPGTTSLPPVDKSVDPKPPPKPPSAALPPVPPGVGQPVYFIPPGLPFYPPPGSRPLPVPFLPSNAPPSSGESLRRPNPFPDAESSPNKKRRVRHCAKCGSQSCKGRGGGSNCPNACRDCGRMECKGRSSTKPNRPCENAAQG